MNKNLKLILFAGSFIALILFQKYVVIPFVFTAAESSLFIDESTETPDPYVISTPITDMAHQHCNQYITKQLDSDAMPSFTPQTINAWNIGNDTYVINAELEYSTKNQTSVLKRYVCRIKYDTSEGDAGLSNYDNWSVYGLSGLE